MIPCVLSISKQIFQFIILPILSSDMPSLCKVFQPQLLISEKVYVVEPRNSRCIIFEIAIYAWHMLTGRVDKFAACLILRVNTITSSVAFEDLDATEINWFFRIPTDG